MIPLADLQAQKGYIKDALTAVVTGLTRVYWGEPSTAHPTVPYAACNVEYDKVPSGAEGGFGEDGILVTWTISIVHQRQNDDMIEVGTALIGAMAGALIPAPGDSLPPGEMMLPSIVKSMPLIDHEPGEGYVITGLTFAYVYHRER